MRKLLITGIALLGCLAFASSGWAQAIKDIRINEVLVFNVDNYEDDYGHREAWIELHNTGYSRVNLAGCYLTIDREGTVSGYRIPTGDARTVIPPQGYVIFIAEGTATKGTFHTNFTLDKTGYIAFYDQSGRGEPINEVEYDVAAQQPDVSIGWAHNAKGALVFGPLATTTPNAVNEEESEVPAHEIFRRADPSGVVMSLTAMTVVFSALILLYLIFRMIGKAMSRRTVRKEQPGTAVAAAPVAAAKEGEASAEEITAISLALHQYFEELEHQEIAVLTINRVARSYSPWSSKLYGLTQTPNKK